jgi:hypothetical protein
VDLTVDLYSASGDEVLRFRTQPAHGALFDGQYHSWYQHIEDGKVVSTVFGTHSWHENEQQAQVRFDQQVASAVKLGWLRVKPVKKAQQLGLF